jgi:lipoate-protein ligase A
LYPGCVVFSFGVWVRHLYRNDRYFQGINRGIIACLESGFPELAGKLAQQGISDLTYEGRKVCGSSLFRSKQYLLFQASLLVEEGLTWIEAYLQHPSKEPAYREGRRHGDFVTFLGAQIPITPLQVQTHLAAHLPQFLFEELGEELAAPDLGHVPYLLRKGGFDS